MIQYTENSQQKQKQKLTNLTVIFRINRVRKLFI